MQTDFTVTPEAAGQRLDVFCVAQAPQYSRAQLQKAIKEGRITVNNTAVKPRHVLRVSDSVTLTMEDVAQPTQATTADLKLPIIYEDRELVVINKPAGVVVHAGQGNEQQSVASWFSNRYPDSRAVGEPAQPGSPIARPGIVHRLDKDTSGVLVLAKTQVAYEHLKDQFKRQRAHKEYLALVFGIPGEPKGRINRALARSRHNPLRRTIDPNGKEAVTEWRLEEKIAGKYALLRIWPLSGRTHQIRVHLHFLGFPIVGDQLYTFKRQRPPHGTHRQLLHAEKIKLTHLNGKRVTFTAPLPADFSAVLQALRTGA